MSLRHVCVFGVAVAIAGAACSTGGAADRSSAAVATSAQVHGSLNEVMRSILFPNSNIIFDLQDRDPGLPVEPGSGGGLYDSVYTGWEKVGIAGIALAESANLIALPGRSCANGRPVPLDDEAYVRAVQGLRDVGMAAYQFAQKEQWSEEAAFELGDQLATACANCHDVYRDVIVDGQMIGIEDRCQ